MAPTGRTHHSAVAFDRSLFVFGGCRDGTNQACTLPHCKLFSAIFIQLGIANEIFEFQLEAREWRRVEWRGTLPQPRAGHAAVVYNDTMLIVGGDEPGAWTEPNTIHLFHFATGSWSSLTLGGDPSAVFISRKFHGAAQDRAFVYITGGESNEGLVGASSFLRINMSLLAGRPSRASSMPTIGRHLGDDDRPYENRG